MPEDRDQIFEKALARSLRSDEPAASLCLDAETLAAFHEHLLSVEEVAAAKEHIVSCERCQEILAHLEATHSLETAESTESRERDVPIVMEAVQVFDEVRAKKPVASGILRTAVPEQPRPPVSIASRKRSTLRWVAPAGAIAAGLLLFLSAREFLNQPKKQAGAVTEPASSTVAPYSDATSPNLQKQATPPASQPFANEQLKELPVAPRELSLRDEMRSGKKDKDSLVADNRLGAAASGAPIRTRQAPSFQLPAAPPPEAPALSVGVVGGAAPSRSLQRRDAAPAVTSPNGELTQAAPAPAPLSLDAAAPVAAPNPAKVVANQPSGAADILSPVSPPPSPAGAAKTKAQNPAPSEEKSLQKKEESQVETSSSYSQRASFNHALSTTGLDIRIAAPGGKNIWSVGPNGAIFFSGDSGRTWRAQFSGVVATLKSGAAPSDQVCWIAGAAGTLLRTTDAGKHWQAIRTPVSGDLGGVHASDAQHATIWDMANRVAYETSDGGATWKQVANE